MGSSVSLLLRVHESRGNDSALEGGYEPDVHLSFEDLASDHPSSPKVRIKASKTDPCRRGVDIYLGRTDTDLCPVQPY